MLSSQDRSRLLTAARQAAPHAYAPYSRLRVGAALLTAQGNLFVGVNVENASYSLTLCAERAAISAAVTAEGPDMRLRALAVVSESDTPLSPCGACRQVMLEFGPDASVLFPGQAGLEEQRVRDLLPEGFHPGQLPE